LAVWYLAIVFFLWGLVKLWTHTIFVLPFTNPEMLWLLVPVWLGWFFSEFFQEKKGTSIGNAISNAVIVLWGSIDCSRQTVNLIVKHTIAGFWNLFLRFFIIAIVFAYGAFIVVLGWKGRKLTKRIGRIRVVTYVFAVFAPVFYNATPLSWQHVLSAVLFFPLFYFAIELIDKYTPNPKAIAEGEEKGSSSSNQTTSNQASTTSAYTNPSPSQPTQQQAKQHSQQSTQQRLYNQYNHPQNQNVYNRYRR